jgi:hypothetical protein
MKMIIRLNRLALALRQLPAAAATATATLLTNLLFG